MLGEPQLSPHHQTVTASVGQAFQFDTRTSGELGHASFSLNSPVKTMLSPLQDLQLCWINGESVQYLLVKPFSSQCCSVMQCGRTRVSLHHSLPTCISAFCCHTSLPTKQLLTPPSQLAPDPIPVFCRVVEEA